MSQATRILRTTNAKGERSRSGPPSCTRSTATRSGSRSHKIKIKLLGGDTFQCDLMGDASNAKTYMKWYFNYLRVIVEKKFDEKLLACSETLKRAIEDLK